MFQGPKSLPPPLRFTRASTGPFRKSTQTTLDVALSDPNLHCFRTWLYTGEAAELRCQEGICESLNHVHLYIFADMILQATSLRRQDLTSPKNIPSVAESKKYDLNNAEAVVYQVIYLTGRKKTKTLHIKAESDGGVPRGQCSIWHGKEIQCIDCMWSLLVRHLPGARESSSRSFGNVPSVQRISLGSYTAFFESADMSSSFESHTFEVPTDTGIAFFGLSVFSTRSM
jgi:hypothetical protein